jgi:hypothetical protein
MLTAVSTNPSRSKTLRLRRSLTSVEGVLMGVLKTVDATLARPEALSTFFAALQIEH